MNSLPLFGVKCTCLKFEIAFKVYIYKSTKWKNRRSVESSPTLIAFNCCRVSMKMMKTREKKVNRRCNKLSAIKDLADLWEWRREVCVDSLFSVNHWGEASIQKFRFCFNSYDFCLRYFIFSFCVLCVIPLSPSINFIQTLILSI